MLLGTRDWLIAAQFAGGAFIVALVVLAMLLVATGPDDMAADDDRPSTH